MLQLERPMGSWARTRICKLYCLYLSRFNQENRSHSRYFKYSRERLIQGNGDLQKHWRGWGRKGQEATGSEGMAGNMPPMIPGASRTKAGVTQEDTWSCWKLSLRVSAAHSTEVGVLQGGPQKLRKDTSDDFCCLPVAASREEWLLLPSAFWIWWGCPSWAEFSLEHTGKGFWKFRGDIQGDRDDVILQWSHMPWSN